MKKSKRTKSNDLAKILRMISRDEELERNDGKWVAMNRVFKDKKKYDRKKMKKDLRDDLGSLPFLRKLKGELNLPSFLLSRNLQLFYHFQIITRTLFQTTALYHLLLV